MKKTTKDNECIDMMQTLFTRTDSKSGYCWTDRHRKCQLAKCDCRCHNAA